MKNFFNKYKKHLAILGISFLMILVVIENNHFLQEKKERESPVRDYTVLCFGDSNTWGDDTHDYSRYPKNVRWTGVLATLLGEHYDVIAEGMNGRTTAYDTVDSIYENGLTVLPPVLATNRPIDVLIFMLGTNDCQKSQNESLADIDEGMKELIHTSRKILRDLQEYEPVIIVVSPPAIQGSVRNTWMADRFDDEAIKKSYQLKDDYENLCKKEHCVFVDGTDTIEVSDLDGVHLSEEGHHQLANMLYETIVGLDLSFES